MSPLVYAVGLGLVVSLLFTEVIGLAAGGFVVPGYIAVYLGDPRLVLQTVVAALLTLICLRLSGRFFLIYGRRSLVLAVLLGFLFSQLTSWIPGHSPNLLRPVVEWALAPETKLIAHIIPGLLAYWMSRQGIVQTLAATLVAAVLVRFALIVFLNKGSLFEAPFV